MNFIQNSNLGSNLQRPKFEIFELGLWIFLEILARGTKDYLG